MDKIGFIGAGNMAQAIVEGITGAFEGIERKVFVSDKDKERAKKLARSSRINLCKNNVQVTERANIILLAVKPNIYQYVLEEIRDYIGEDHILVSIAAGISIEYIQSFFKTPVKIVRTMPNTPALVGEGMTAVSANNQLTQKELDGILKIFNSIGRTDLIGEELMDMIPSISGSSPAYVYMFIEALADGGVLQGMPRDKAYKYAAQAVLGGAKMVLETGKHPGELKDQVCSPGGTTIKAVHSLEKNSFRGSIIDAMIACTEKAKNMSK